MKRWICILGAAVLVLLLSWAFNTVLVWLAMKLCGMNFSIGTATLLWILK